MAGVFKLSSMLFLVLGRQCGMGSEKQDFCFSQVLQVHARNFGVKSVVVGDALMGSSFVEFELHRFSHQSCKHCRRV